MNVGSNWSGINEVLIEKVFRINCTLVASISVTQDLQEVIVESFSWGEKKKIINKLLVNSSFFIFVLRT